MFLIRNIFRFKKWLSKTTLFNFKNYTFKNYFSVTYAIDDHKIPIYLLKSEIWQNLDF